MVFGYFTLLVALTISAVAEFYSIVGLTAIFSAAFWPVVIMGASLGIGKITAAVWLKLNWERAGLAYKLYLVPAVAFLMLLTSMGIFGYLSKAHSDQSLVSGDSMAKVAIYDEKIKTERENIDANRKALKQLDEAVDQVMGRSTDEKGADKAVAIRRGQQKERGRLLQEIAESQKRITTLNEERAPLAIEFRKVEAEVGPIKYIAALVYGDNPDANILEKAVRLVIILIVAVFDPLALVLILAAQQSLRWARDESAPKYEPDDGPLTPEQTQQIKDSTDPHPPGWMFDDTKPLEPTPPPPVEPEPTVVEPVEPDPTTVESVEAELPHQEEESEDSAIKAAVKKWKLQNPNDTIKNQRHKFMRGEIAELPWMKLVADNAPNVQPNNGFGTAFPADANRGDTFVRTDAVPNLLYKFNGTEWIQVDKNLSDSYTYDSAYIDYLIDKISTGEYDIDLLSDSERQQVEQHLKNKAK